MRTAGQDNQSNRERWVRARLAELPAGMRILDAGAGKQPYRGDCQHLRYVAQDFGGYDGQGNGAGLQTGGWTHEGIDIFSDITAIPESNGSFDALLCTEVFEHIPDPIAAIREFARLLTPGGHLFLTAPFTSLTHYSPYHFGTGFSRYFYEHHLPAHGFDIVEITFNGSYFAFLRQEIERLPAVCRRYTLRSPNRLETWAMRIVRAALLRAEAADSGSHELLSFGVHIHAIRRGKTQTQAVAA